MKYQKRKESNSHCNISFDLEQVYEGESKQPEDGQDNGFENKHRLFAATQRNVHTVTGESKCDFCCCYLRFKHVAGEKFTCFLILQAEEIQTDWKPMFLSNEEFRLARY